MNTKIKELPDNTLIVNHALLDGAAQAAAVPLAAPAGYSVTRTDNTLQSPGRTLGEWRNGGAFAVIKTNGSVVTWGYGDYGGDSSRVAD